MTYPRGEGVVGIDEAGRGPLAGPVVAAACIITEPLLRLRDRAYPAWSPRKKGGVCIIGDSKRLTRTLREEAYAWLIAHCPFGVGMSTAKDIDRYGILRATENAMRQAVRRIGAMHPRAARAVLVDGRDGFLKEYGAIAIVRGDQTESCIAAASIIAKVTRDRWMESEAQTFPAYGFERNKGYGSAFHLAALTRYGPCALHRASFLKKFRERAARERARG